MFFFQTINTNEVFSIANSLFCFNERHRLFQRTGLSKTIHDVCATPLSSFVCNVNIYSIIESKEDIVI